MGSLGNQMPFNIGGSKSSGLMGPISNLIGSQNNFEAAKPSLIQTTNNPQINAANAQSLAALQQMNALNPQLAALHGIGNEASAYGQMQGLANQYQGLANGTGPNIALDQLNQTTGQNVANQAALMGGQRGAGANAGLLARQIAQQGANTQQQAVGQAATMRAQQQLAAMQGLQQQQGMLGNYAANEAGQQIGQTNAYDQAAQNYQANLLNAAAGLNAANVNATSNQNTVNAGVAGQNAQTNGQMFGSMMNGAGGMMAMMADGGEVADNGPQLDPDKVKQFLQGFGAPKTYAGGGEATDGPSSFVGQYMAGGYTPVQANANFASPAPVSLPTTPTYDSGGGKSGGGGGGGMGSLIGLAALLNTGGEAKLPGSNLGAYGADGSTAGMSHYAHGGAPNPKLQQSHLKDGGKVHGKASVPGDSLQNDTVKAQLSPGEIVIPRSIAQGPNAPARSAEFVRQVLVKKRGKLGNRGEGT